MPAPFTTVFLVLAIVFALLNLLVPVVVFTTLALAFEGVVFYLVGAPAESPPEEKEL